MPRQIKPQKKPMSRAGHKTVPKNEPMPVPRTVPNICMEIPIGLEEPQPTHKTQVVQRTMSTEEFCFQAPTYLEDTSMQNHAPTSKPREDHLDVQSLVKEKLRNFEKSHKYQIINISNLGYPNRLSRLNQLEKSLVGLSGPPTVLDPSKLQSELD